MGGGASKRAKMRDELEQRVTTITDETAELVKTDQGRQTRIRAALKIQKVQRGIFGRQKANARRHLLHDGAATEIERVARGRRSRAHQARRQAAAAKIQRCWRGRAARDGLRQKQQAATVVQSAFRGRKDRKAVAATRMTKHEALLHEGAMTLQRLCRRRFEMAELGARRWRRQQVLAALLVQRRFRYIRQNGNWLAACMVSRKLRASGLVQKWMRSFLCRLHRRKNAQHTARMTLKLLEGLRLSRLWPKWGPTFHRGGRTDGPPGCYGGWALSYEQVLSLAECQVGGKGLATPKSWVQMPLAEWGLPSADRARLCGKTKVEGPRWARRKAKEAAEREALRLYEEEHREDIAATKIQRWGRGRQGRKKAVVHRARVKRDRELLGSGWRYVRTDPKWRDKAEAGLGTEERLRMAARRGDKAVVAELLGVASQPGPKQVDLDSTDELGRSALYLACLEGHQLIAKSLWRKGASATLRDNDGSTPFIAACHEGNIGVIRWLHEEVKVDTESPELKVGATPFLMACHAGQINVVAYIAEKIGTDPNVATSTGVTPFFLAAYRGNLRLAKYLVRCGFNTKRPAHTSEGQQRTPQEVAEINGYVEVVNFIKKTHAMEEARAEEAERKRLALLPKPKKDVSAFGVKELNLSRAEMRAIEMWIVHDRLNQFGDPSDHVYVRQWKGEFLKSDHPNGFTFEKASRHRYIIQENSLVPWARFRADAKVQTDQLTGGWRRGKGAFTFGKRTGDDNSLANTVSKIKDELGIEPHYYTGEEETPKEVALLAANSAIPHNAITPMATRADAVAAGMVADTGEEEALSYLECLDLAARVAGMEPGADWAGRDGWVQRGGRTNCEMGARCAGIIEAVVELTGHDSAGDVSSQFKDNFGGLSSAKLKFRKVNAVLTANTRMGSAGKIREREKGPPRQLAASLLKLPDPNKHPAYYDIVRDPIDIETMRRKIGRDEYPDMLAFRQELQRLFCNGRVTAGRGTQLWDDLTAMEAVAVEGLAKATTRLAYVEEVWPEWNTVPPEIGVMLLPETKDRDVMWLPSETLEEVKTRIAEAFGCPVGGRRFTKKGKVLTEQTPMEEIGVEAGDRLQLEPYITVRMGATAETAGEEEESAGSAAGEPRLFERVGRLSRPPEPGEELAVALVLTDRLPRMRSRLKEAGVDTTGLIFLTQPGGREVGGEEALETLEAAGVEPGSLLLLVPEPVYEPPPMDEVDAATHIQSAARGRRARLAIGFALVAGGLTRGLFRAVMGDDVPMLASLLATGADSTARNPGGHSLLDFASERGRTACVRYLNRISTGIYTEEEVEEEEVAEEEEPLEDNGAEPGRRDGGISLMVVDDVSALELPGSRSHLVDCSSRAGSRAGSSLAPGSRPGSAAVLFQGQPVAFEPLPAWDSMTEADLVKAELQQVVAEGESWRAELDFFSRTIVPLRRPSTAPGQDSDSEDANSVVSDRPSTAPGNRSTTSLEPGGPRRRRPHSAIPAPRLLVGAYSSLCTDPLVARGAPQRGPDFFYRRDRGNQSMHLAIGRVAACTRPKGRPRALKAPRADPMMEHSRLYTPEDTLDQVMARFDHAESIRVERKKEEKKLQLAIIQGRVPAH